MRVAVVGPGHPQKGGVALHTSDLAKRLDEDGHEVAHVGWRRPYPRLLYPGSLRVEGSPELATSVRVQQRLDWYDPLGWSRAGRAAGHGDLAVLVHVTPVQAPALATVAQRCRTGGARVAVVAHNVVPHEPRPGDEALTRELLRRADLVVTHTEAEGAAAARLTGARILVRPLPVTLPDAVAAAAEHTPARSVGESLRLVVPGIVRHYKGVDVLLRAMASAPGTTVVVAGEFWVDVDELSDLARELGIAERVELRPGYLPAARLAETVLDSDVVVLPYRSGTGSQNAALARALGRPVVATRVGSFVGDVHAGEDGLLVEPDDPDSLARALRALRDRTVVDRLAAGARGRGAVQGQELWRGYLDAIVSAVAGLSLAPGEMP